MTTDRVNLIPAAYLSNKWGPPLLLSPGLWRDKGQGEAVLLRLEL